MAREERPPSQPVADQVSFGATDAVAPATDRQPPGHSQDTSLDSGIAGGESQPPRRFGKYELLRVLGAGAYATVYLANDTLLSREVALKLLDHGRTDRPDIRQRILLEARSVTRLNHERTVAVHDINECEGQPYIAMEWMKGGSTQRAIDERGAIGWREATRWIRDAGIALAAAHQAGMLHRDIKPGNLLLDDEGRVKLGDFGLVKWNGAIDSRLTLPGGPIGTPSYMSPEQCQAEPLDECSDIYSLGATYFAFLTGRPPYQADTPLGVMFAHCSSPLPDLAHLESIAPAACAAVIRRALAKNPVDRFQSADEFLAALPSPDDEQASASSPKPARRTRRRLAWSGATFAAALALGSLFWIPRGPDLPAQPAASDQASAAKPTPEPESSPQIKPFSSLTQVGDHRGSVMDIDVNLAGDRIWSVATGGVLAAWDPKQPGKPTKRLVDPEAAGARLFALGLFPSRALALVGGDGRDLVLWDLESGTIVRRVPHGHKIVRAIGVSKEEAQFATGGDIGWNLWELSSDNQLVDRGPLRDDLIMVHAVRFAPVQSVLVAASGNGYVAIHSLLNPSACQLLKLSDQGIAVASGKTRCEMVFGTQQGRLVHQSTSSRLQSIGQLTRVDFNPSAMDFAPNRRVVAVGGKNDGSVTFYDLEQKIGFRRLSPSASRVTALRFSRDGEHLALGTPSGAILWAKVPTEDFGPPTPPKDLALDAVANYIPTSAAHFTKLKEFQSLLLSTKDEEAK